MPAEHLLFILIVFAIAAGTVFFGVYLLSPTTVQRRLDSISGGSSTGGTDPSVSKWTERLAEAVAPFAKLSVPDEDWDKSPLRRRFMNAGWRSPGAPSVFFAVKTVLVLALPLLASAVIVPFSTSLTGDMMLFIALSLAAIGFYAPNIVLRRSVEARQREIFENFPDALDLLTVCVEAGLSLEQAMTKVADEMQLNSLSLSQELHIVLIEMRAGFTKEKALRNLALRTGVEDIDTLVAMLIQSERFGTSMGESLRVHSENLRSKRRFRAEEAAAKIAIKLLFPLIFLIFPTLLLVLLGPAILQIYRIVLPSISGGA